jgi:triosephosphate isomerase
MTARKKIIAANWKMNLTHQDVKSYADVLRVERRAQFGETDEIVNRKIKAALSSGLQPIFCVGETLTERDGQRVEEVLKRQIQEGLKEVNPRHFPDLVVAYEPLWAIGTGRTATPEQAQRTHAFIRSVIALVSDHSAAEQVRIQYGAM